MSENSSKRSLYGAAIVLNGKPVLGLERGYSSYNEQILPLPVPFEFHAGLLSKEDGARYRGVRDRGSLQNLEVSSERLPIGVS